MSAPRSRRPVDWNALKRKVEGAGVGQGEWALDPDRRRQILTERARLLAREPPAATDATTVALVSLSLQGETWAVHAGLVWDVFRLVEFTPLPGASAPVAGITGWRGSVLTVLNVQSVLGLPAGALGDLHYVIVVGEERPEFGILADALGELVALDARDVREPPEGVAGHRDYVLGVTPGTLLVLDVPRLLRDTVEPRS